MRFTYYAALALAVGLILGVGGWLIFGARGTSGGSEGSSVSTTSATSTLGAATTTELGSSVGVETTGGQAVVSATGSTPTPTPPATPALAFSASLDTDAKAALQTQWNTLTAGLRSAPNRLDLWLELGVVYKIAGQYNAAIAAWDYVAHNGPNSINYVAYGDLGDLYLNFTHEYPKAIAAYQAALKIDSTNPDFQNGLKTAEQLNG